MFTGIIEEVGKIKKIEKSANVFKLKISCNVITDDLNLGDSVSVNGVCLTASDLDKEGFTADVMPETLRETALSELKFGSSVNLERALTLSSRLGGHIVTGHIDTVSKILSIKRERNAVWYKIAVNRDIANDIMKKGSVAVDGISLTIADCSPDNFSVSLIPHTHKNTALSDKKAGDKVNIETDILKKYIAQMIGR